MKSKNSIKILFSSAIVLFLIFAISAHATTSAKVIVSAVPIKKTVSAIPVSIIIPKMNINAIVESTGLTKDGAMDVPKGHTNAGWYNLGTRPGDVGSAVIDGHVGRWKNGDISVFDTLTKLTKGDLVYIKNKDGVTITFVVRKIEIYGDDQNASDVFTSSDGLAHLNLITCTGIYTKSDNSYSSRLIVFTDKVS